MLDKKVYLFSIFVGLFLGYSFIYQNGFNLKNLLIAFFIVMVVKTKRYKGVIIYENK